MNIHGGDKVLLDNGKVVKVCDIRQKGGALKENYIIVACDEWYPFSEIKEVVERFNA